MRKINGTKKKAIKIQIKEQFFKKLKDFQDDFMIKYFLKHLIFITQAYYLCQYNKSNIIIFNIYMKLILSILLVSFCTSTVLLQSNTQLKMSSPGHIGQTVVLQTLKTKKIPKALDAVWIWSKGWDVSTCVNPLIIQGDFITESTNPITYYMSADDNFTLFVDGIKMMDGNDWQKLYEGNSSLSCGLHTFKIISYNAGPCAKANTAGLIYAFVQDNSTNKCPKKLPLVSNTQLQMISPGRVGQSVAQTTSSTKISQAPDAVWIWSKGWNAAGCVNPLIVQQDFIVQSSNPISFYVIADNNFTLQIDGTQVFNGSDWSQLFSKNFSLGCGKHTFRITAYNFGDCTATNPAGLIYAFLQDNSTKACAKKLAISNTQLKMLSPGHIGQSVAQATTYTKKISQAPDAVWIWSKGWNAAGCVNPLIVQGDFIVQSSNPVSFYVIADNNFTLQIDGTQVFNGSDWSQLFSKDFSLGCGKHTFRITAYNLGDCTATNPAGLIYAFLQDTSTKICPKKLAISNTQLKMLSPSHIGQSVAQATTYTKKISQAPDAVWIWSKGWNAAGCVNPLIVQGDFIVQSSNPVSFYVIADNNFTLQIDGTQVFNGSDWSQLFSKDFSLGCGKHTFRITAYNLGDCTATNPAGLIYAFLQDTSTKICPKKLAISNTQLKMLSPSHIGQSVVQATTFTSKIPQAHDAVWIWSKGWNAAGCVNPLIIQQDFIVQSSNPVSFYVIADNNFTLQIDGTQVFNGSDWSQLFSKDFSLGCGKHTFRITAYNFGDCTATNPAGLIYAFLQDTSTKICPTSSGLLHLRKFTHIKKFSHIASTSRHTAKRIS